MSHERPSAHLYPVTLKDKPHTLHPNPVPETDAPIGEAIVHAIQHAAEREALPAA